MPLRGGPPWSPCPRGSGRKGRERGGAARAGVPEESSRSLVPPPRRALLQHPLHDFLFVGQPVDGEDVEPTEDHDTEGTGSHRQPGPRELPCQYSHGPSRRVSPGPPAGAHRSPGVPGGQGQRLSTTPGQVAAADAPTAGPPCTHAFCSLVCTRRHAPAAPAAPKIRARIFFFF